MSQFQKLCRIQLSGYIISTSSNELDEIVTIWSDNFDGTQNWTPSNFLTRPAFWHTDSFGAYENGISWWCGDSEIGGYNNFWLQYLETTGLDFSNIGENLTLSFQKKLECEVAYEPYMGYNAYDGANVWYSFDDGESWDLLVNPDPIYNVASIYSFGYTFGMGTGISGWDGIPIYRQWHEVSYNLDFLENNSNVKFRFAFASDEATCTAETGDTGFFIDDILIEDESTVYLENDAENTAIPADLIPIEQEGPGNDWTLQQNSSHSIPNAWFVEHGNNLNAVLATPVINLPELSLYDFIYLDYWVLCDMPDYDGDGDLILDDYYAIDISLDDTDTWQRLVYDFAAPDVNGNSQHGWTYRRTGVFNSSRLDYIDLSQYAGNDIRLRFVAYSDNNDDGGTGSGLYIDNVRIIGDAFPDHDLEVTKINLSYPLTVGYPVAPMAFLKNNGIHEESTMASWIVEGQQFSFDPVMTISAGEIIPFIYDEDAHDGIDGWIPDEAGSAVIAAVTELMNDEVAENDSTGINIEVSEAGRFILGYDNRRPTWNTSQFNIGEGPMTLFQVPEHITDVQLMGIKMMWNNDFDENHPHEIQVIYHILDDEMNLIESFPRYVEPDHLYPDFHIAWMESQYIFLNPGQSFYCWVELEDEYFYPHAVYTDQTNNWAYYFNYDGSGYSPSGKCWMMHAVLNANYASVDDQISLQPEKFVLNSIYPNPFNSSIQISFSLAQNAITGYNVYNLNGREVVNFAKQFAAGNHVLNWKANPGLASGTYILQLNSDGNIISSNKVILIK